MPPHTTRLPTSVAEVDRRWVASALRSRYPDVDVGAVRVREVQYSTATRIFVDLELGDDAVGLPRQLCIKGGFDCAAFDKRAVTFRHEAFAYADLLPHVSVHAPTCYFAAVDDSNGQGVVILEDIVAAGGTVNHDLESPTVDGAAEYLDTLAGLHASSWDAALLDRLSWLKVTLAADNFDRHWFDAAELALYLDERGRSAAVDPTLHDPSRLIEMLQALAPIAARRPRCVLHGDTHMNNTYRAAGGAAGFLDWQGVKLGPWARDVSYFMASNLDTELRRSHERELLAYYLDRLAGRGVPAPPFEQAWTEYRRWMLVPLLVWIRNSDESQPPAVNMLGAQRSSAAVMDLEALELFD